MGVLLLVVLVILFGPAARPHSDRPAPARGRCPACTFWYALAAQGGPASGRHPAPRRGKGVRERARSHAPGRTRDERPLGLDAIATLQSRGPRRTGGRIHRCRRRCGRPDDEFTVVSRFRHRSIFRHYIWPPFPIRTLNFFYLTVVVCPLESVSSLAHSLPFSFPRREGEQSEMYPFTIVSHASNGGDCVGSGISSRYRAGACIYRDRVLCEGSKSKNKSLLDYQFSLAG
jgi:hypothetical protein